MFDVLIREAGARFGLGDQAPRLVRMLLAFMTAKETGGLAGFLEKFKAADMGPMVQSWLGGGPSAQPVSNSQLEQVFGASGGLIPMLTGKLGLQRDNVTSALGYLVPAIVGKLTPGGNLPSQLPAEVNNLINEGQSLLAAPTVAAGQTVAAGKSGIGKWLPWIIVAIAALFALSYCNKNKTETPPEPAPVSTPAENDASAAVSDADDAMGDTIDSAGDAVSDAVDAVSDAASDAVDAAGDVAQDLADGAKDTAQAASDGISETGRTVMDYLASLGQEPEGAGAVAVTRDGLPGMNVYFDAGDESLAADFGERAQGLVDYLKNHPWMTARIAGFTSDGGSEASELAMNRASAVKAALALAGVPDSQIEVQEPLEAGGDSATDAAARRIEISLQNNEPQSAGLIAWLRGDMPAVNVYFDTGASDVHADFATKAADVLDYLKTHDDVEAVVSGYHDPTGDAAVNEALARERAEAVRDALVAEGISEDRVVLEKPADASGTDEVNASNATARRVEVVLRKS